MWLQTRTNLCNNGKQSHWVYIFFCDCISEVILTWHIMAINLRSLGLHRSKDPRLKWMFASWGSTASRYLLNECVYNLGPIISNYTAQQGLLNICISSCVNLLHQPFSSHPSWGQLLTDWLLTYPWMLCSQDNNVTGLKLRERWGVSTLLEGLSKRSTWQIHVSTSLSLAPKIHTGRVISVC